MLPQVYFIATEALGAGGHLPTGGPSIWCVLDQSNFFNEYKLEGVTADQVTSIDKFLISEGLI
jgi:hypothetical protein